METKIYHSIIHLLFTICSLPLVAQPIFSDGSQPFKQEMNSFNRGVSIGDFNGDGWEDIAFTSLNQPLRIFQNLDGKGWAEVAKSLSIEVPEKSNAAVWFDLDNDGDQDLYVGLFDAANQLFINQGDHFENRTVSAGVGDSGQARSVLAADVDQDGLLDLYVANLRAENVLYHNQGDGTFADVTQASGATDPGINMGAIFFDYDLDGDQDLYLAHDANQVYILYQNQGDGTFVNVSDQAGVAYHGQGMGVDIGDANRDGFPDIYITNLYENTLYLNNGDGTFTDESLQAGIQDRGMGWGVSWLDYNNDGLLDIYVTNDTYFPNPSSPNLLYQNNGVLPFQIVSDGTLLSSPLGGYGNASFDFNHDGKLDLVVANDGSDGNQLFQNETDSVGNWIEMELEGTISNRDAVGSQVQVFAGESVWTDWVIAGSGYSSQSSKRLHFGLGEIEKIDSIVITWPSQYRQVLNDNSVNQSVYILELENTTKVISFHESPQFTVWPNPTASNWNVLIPDKYAGETTFQIYNSTGKRIFIERSISRNENLITISADKFIPGIYLLKISDQLGKWQCLKRLFKM